MSDRDLVTSAAHFHAGEPPRGLSGVAQSRLYRGRLGRMFRNLMAPERSPSDDELALLASTMFEDAATDDDEARSGRRRPTGRP